MWVLDRLVLELLGPLAIWVFVSGLDDLFLDLSFCWLWLRGRLSPPLPADDGLRAARREPRIALLVPCWQEADVIESMLIRNADSIDYPRYEIWVGLYPNDPESIEAVDRAAKIRSRIRRCVAPHPGPTTKADNLNQLLAGILNWERRTQHHYDLFVYHDAEDLIDSRELRAAADRVGSVAMSQFPVFPLETPLADFTHGVYADEFAEAHVKDLRVRAETGGFVPSAGVGTALSREVIDRLLVDRGHEILDPHCLTEDYFLGLEVRRRGFRQAFPFLRTADSGHPVATRSYFPRTFRNAVRQRTRWIIGTNLQSLERFGWRVSPRQLYWLWRDRKGMVNHAASLAANLLFLYGLARWGIAGAISEPWQLGNAIAADRLLLALIAVNAALFLWRALVRCICCKQVYGWTHSLAVPFRAPWGNLINFCAVANALRVFLSAKLYKRSLSWSKTAHAFPEPGRQSQSTTAGG